MTGHPLFVKKTQNLQLYQGKTTNFILLPYNFARIDILIIFAMTKDTVKRVSVWEKVSDFMMDISKYVLTAVIITSAFEELSEVGWMMYLVGLAGSVLLLSVSLFIINKINRTK